MLSIFLVAAVLADCRASSQGQSPETARIKAVVSEFIMQAYSADGDIGQAYALLDSATQRTCSRNRFVQEAKIARQIIGGRQLKIDSISDVRVSGTTATLKVKVSMGRTWADFIPQATTLVEENGDWYYRVTTNPTCDPLGDFFLLGTRVPGVRVTPVYDLDANCERGYPFECIPKYPPKLECKDIPYRKFIVQSPDPHGFDPDGNGFGCEK
jgi:hypothetical protein